MPYDRGRHQKRTQVGIIHWALPGCDSWGPVHTCGWCLWIQNLENHGVLLLRVKHWPGGCSVTSQGNCTFLLSSVECLLSPSQQEKGSKRKLEKRPTFHRTSAIVKCTHVKPKSEEVLRNLTY